jgi:hypothetical protein
MAEVGEKETALQVGIRKSRKYFPAVTYAKLKQHLSGLGLEEEEVRILR